MDLDLILGDMDAVSEDEWEDGDDETVEEEVGEEADADGADDEDGAGAPLETDWLGLGHGCGVVYEVVNGAVGGGGGGGGLGACARRFSAVR